jgi:hypothetical protein
LTGLWANKEEDDNTTKQRRYYVKSGLYVDHEEKVLKSRSVSTQEVIFDKTAVDLKSLFPSIPCAEKRSERNSTVPAGGHQPALSQPPPGNPVPRPSGLELAAHCSARAKVPNDLTRGTAWHSSISPYGRKQPCKWISTYLIDAIRVEQAGTA